MQQPATAEDGRDHETRRHGAGDDERDPMA
jgi:hypothetical protein